MDLVYIKVHSFSARTAFLVFNNNLISTLRIEQLQSAISYPAPLILLVTPLRENQTVISLTSHLDIGAIVRTLQQIED